MKLRVAPVILTMLCLPLCSYAQYKKCTPCAKSDLKGKVKKLTEVETLSESEREKYVYHYNEAGLLADLRDSVWADEDEKDGSELVQVTNTKYIYDSGRLIREEVELRSTSGPQGKRTVEYKYDAKGRVVLKTTQGSPDGLEIQEETTYNDAEGKATRKQLSRKKGKELVEDARRRFVDVYKDGRVAEEWLYLPDSNDYLLHQELKYDQDGNMTESRTYKNGAVTRLRTFSFDKEARITSARFEIPGINSERTYTYTYSEPDNHGNYLRSVSTEGISTRRQIEYYE
jgi:hypothetical protein